MSGILIIGEAWGAEEEQARAPFVGATGYLLTQLLSEAGIHRADCHLTNVFNLRPPGNQIERILTNDRNEAIRGYPALVTTKKSQDGGRYVPQSLIPQLSRLADEIESVDPNIIICLGNTPTWALLGKTGISKIRGTTTMSTHLVAGYKILPTYHPAMLFKGADNWKNRPVVVLDLMKAKGEAEFPEIRRPPRQIWIEPSLEDIREFAKLHIREAKILSVDIETSGTQITCIGFAPNAGVGIVIPFDDTRRKGRCYWGNEGDERQAWKIVKGILENPHPRKLFQNGLYDIAFLWRSYKIKVRGAAEDSMLLHHALQPESLKGLGFLGSLYTDEGAWKQMRKVQTIKRDD